MQKVEIPRLPKKTKKKVKTRTRAPRWAEYPEKPIFGSFRLVQFAHAMVFLLP